MGKSTTSCFKMIACGGDSVDHDDIQTTESKSSSDRRGWSFRKRSARHRVLSNSVTTEALLTENKETPESTAVNFHVQPDLTVPEKTSVVQLTEEKTDLSAQQDLKLSENVGSAEKDSAQQDLKLSENVGSAEKDSAEQDSKLSEIGSAKKDSAQQDSKLAENIGSAKKDSTQPDSKLSENVGYAEEDYAQQDSKLSQNVGSAKKDDSGADATPDEPSIIVIQAAIRGLLAQKVLLKQKNVIKLQAVVRGHLVRRYAVGTLRCVQAIIRMQALVRARNSRLLAEQSGDSAKQSESSGNNTNESSLLRKKKEKSNGSYTYVSIDKLLGNAFARQLLESTARTKPINIKCEPLKYDSAWKWLERWMSVSSVTSEEPQESKSDLELDKEHIGHSNGKEDVLLPGDCYSETTDFTSGADASAEASKKEDKLIIDDSDNLDPSSFKPVSPSSSHSDLHSVDGPNSTCEITEFTSVEKLDAKSFPKEEIGEPDIPDSKKLSAEQPETEAKKFSRKPSNPAFIAAQSKFEELSSAAPSNRLIKSSIHDSGVDSTVGKVSSSIDQPFRSRDFGLADHPPAIQIGGSECGTELSVSSTLDSPERSEAGVNDIEQETKVSEVTEQHCRSRESLEHEANGKSMILETDLSRTDSNKLERDESINSATADSLNPMTAIGSAQLEKEPDTESSKPELVQGSEASPQFNKSSPEASPRSHIIVPESQATPSTEVSVKPKRNRGEESESNRKNKSSSADKKSLSNRNQDSASRSSWEQLQDHKTGKRRNSLGSGKPDHKELGPRDSGSSNSLPSYMQPTESARAKAIANGSPRSSPDVHEKDIYIKKRHSLPGSNERQGSPRIQRSLSQAQQNAKGNVTQSPQERMWRR